jgi:hypothetical protein
LINCKRIFRLCRASLNFTWMKLTHIKNNFILSRINPASL